MWGGGGRNSPSECHASVTQVSRLPLLHISHEASRLESADAAPPSFIFGNYAILTLRVYTGSTSDVSGGPAIFVR